MGVILNAVSFVSGWIAMFVLAICIASGLYLASELAEECSSLMRKIVKYSISVLVALHIILWIDGIPILHTLGGIACNLAFLPLLQTFPFVEPISIQSMGALAAVVVNHIVWFNYYGKGEIETTVMGLLGYFLVFVWALPTMCFVSLTPAEEALPGGASFHHGVSGNPQRNGAFGGGGKKKGGASFFKQMMDSVLSKKTDVVQNLAPGQTKRYY